MITERATIPTYGPPSILTELMSRPVETKSILSHTSFLFGTSPKTYTTASREHYIKNQWVRCFLIISFGIHIRSSATSASNGNNEHFTSLVYLLLN
ncbi:hypothetical protein ACTXT7_009101 [Hymenolepis weldensis]